MMKMVCTIEKPGKVTIFETVEAVIEVFLVKASALSSVAFVVTIEVGQQIPVNNCYINFRERKENNNSTPRQEHFRDTSSEGSLDPPRLLSS